MRGISIAAAAFAIMTLSTAAAQNYDGGPNDARLKQTPACRHVAQGYVSGTYVGCCKYGVSNQCRGLSNYGIGCCNFPPRH